MGNIYKRKIDGKNQISLTFSYRKDGKPTRKEKKIGSKLPPPVKLDELQDKFDYEVFTEFWKKDIEKLQQKYINYIKKYPNGLKKKELRQFGVLFTHNSTKIEGSTLTYRDTQLLLEEGITPNNKPIEDVVETQAHMKTYEEMTDSKKRPLTLALIKEWHKKQFFRIKSSMAGIFRGKGHEFNVRIGNSKYKPPPWDKVQQELQHLDLWFKTHENQYHPVFLAAKYHLWFIAIHPFSDGNGRTGRLIMNFILHKNNYPMFDVDPAKKRQYFNALERAMVKHNDLLFIGWFCRNYIRYTQKYLAFFD